MAEEGSSLEQLTWDDLTLWAGAKILSRGKSYKQNVKDLRRTNDGGILAWVHGTKEVRYHGQERFFGNSLGDMLLPVLLVSLQTQCCSSPCLSGWRETQAGCSSVSQRATDG